MLIEISRAAKCHRSEKNEERNIIVAGHRVAKNREQDPGDPKFKFELNETKSKIIFILLVDPGSGKDSKNFPSFLSNSHTTKKSDPLL